LIRPSDAFNEPSDAFNEPSDAFNKPSDAFNDFREPFILYKNEQQYLWSRFFVVILQAKQ